MLNPVRAGAATTCGALITALALGLAASAGADKSHAKPPGTPVAVEESASTDGTNAAAKNRKKTPRQPGTGTTLVGGERTYYPHGGWSSDRYYYFPDAGFGRSGLYSWYYGRPYASTYPYSYYVQSPYYTPPWVGTVTSLPTWLRISPGSARGSYGNFTFVGPQVSAFPGWSAAFPNSGYTGVAALASPRPWFTPGVDSGTLQANGAPNWADGYLQALSEQEQRRREPWAALTVEVAPETATLYVDGNPVGTAEQFARPGARLSFPAGTYHLEIAANGYETEALDLRLAAGQPLTVKRVLKKATPQEPAKAEPVKPEKAPGTAAAGRPRGEVLLVVAPADARVTVDGRSVCRAVAPGEEFRCRLPAGPHTLEATRDGYRPYKEEVIVSPLQPLARELRLQSR